MWIMAHHLVSILFFVSYFLSVVGGEQDNSLFIIGLILGLEAKVMEIKEALNA